MKAGVKWFCAFLLVIVMAVPMLGSLGCSPETLTHTATPEPSPTATPGHTPAWTPVATPTPKPSPTPTPTPRPSPTGPWAIFETDWFTIEYPKGWVESEALKAWEQAKFPTYTIHAALAPAADAKTPSLLVMAFMVPGGPYEMWQIFPYLVETSWPDKYGEITETVPETPLTVDDLDALIYGFSWNEEGTTYQVKLLFVIDGLMLYTIKCYSTAAKYSQYEAIFDHILHSFTLSP